MPPLAHCQAAHGPRLKVELVDTEINTESILSVLSIPIVCRFSNEPMLSVSFLSYIAESGIGLKFGYRYLVSEEEGIGIDSP